MRRNLHLDIVALVLVLASCRQPFASSTADLEERISSVENGSLRMGTIIDRIEYHNVPICGYLKISRC